MIVTVSLAVHFRYFDFNLQLVTFSFTVTVRLSNDHNNVSIKC